MVDKNLKRKPGYYWIRFQNENWAVAEYDEDGYWWQIGWDVAIPPDEKEGFEIHETPIPIPYGGPVHTFYAPDLKL